MKNSTLKNIALMLAVGVASGVIVGMVNRRLNRDEPKGVLA